MVEEQKKGDKPDNVIFVGRGKADDKGNFKDNFDRYVNIIQGVYNRGHKEIILMARGGQIAKAVSLALHKNFENILEVESVKIYTEVKEKKGEREGDDGKMITMRSSNIDIKLKKK